MIAHGSTAVKGILTHAKAVAARQLRDSLGWGLRTLRAQFPAFSIASPAAAACRRPQAGRGRQRFANKSLPGEGAASTFAIWPASPDKKRIAFGRANF